MTDRWAAELADTLTDVGRQLAWLAEWVAVDWPDDRGREWIDRAGQLRRELAQRAVDAVELGALTAPTVGSPAVDSAGRAGVRLGGLDGRRVDDERGIRIAELPPG